MNANWLLLLASCCVSAAFAGQNTAPPTPAAAPVAASAPVGSRTPPPGSPRPREQAGGRIEPTDADLRKSQEAAEAALAQAQAQAADAAGKSQPGAAKTVDYYSRHPHARTVKLSECERSKVPQQSVTLGTEPEGRRIVECQAARNSARVEIRSLDQMKAKTSKEIAELQKKAVVKTNTEAERKQYADQITGLKRMRANMDARQRAIMALVAPYTKPVTPTAQRANPTVTPGVDKTRS